MTSIDVAGLKTLNTIDYRTRKKTGEHWGLMLDCTLNLRKLFFNEDFIKVMKRNFSLSSADK